MAKDIKATLTHCSSTDKNPNHENCPPGPAGWCFYNNARAKNEEPKSHSEMSIRLTPELVKRMEPLYNRLSDEKLLSRCARGATQNANESLHALVWRYCPKTVFVTRPRLELAVAHAVAEFNMGTLGALFLRKGTVEITYLGPVNKLQRQETVGENSRVRSKRRGQRENV